MKIKEKSSITPVGAVTLYKGRGEAWFLYQEEAIHHLNGHTTSEASALITGKGMPRYPFAKEGKKMNAMIFTREFRKFLEGSGYDANAA